MRTEQPGRPPHVNGSAEPIFEDEAPWLADGSREPGEDDEPTPGNTASPPPATAIERRWRPLSPSTLEVAPAPRRYLLRHPDADGKACPLGQGDGLLLLAIVALLASAGGVGKTYALVALAIAIITGRRWLGYYEVDREARGRRVLLALAEEDLEEAERRAYDVARAYNLSAEERELVRRQLMILPLHGEQVPLVTFGHDGRTVVDSAELAALRRLLHSEAGAEGWALVALDPMIRFSGRDTESDNALATAFLSRLETLNSVPGHPTVLLSHHTNQLSRDAGDAKARGVTALIDGPRWAATLRSTPGGAAFKQVKSNGSRPMFEELALVREKHSGLLRVPSEAEARERREEEELKAEAREAADAARKTARAKAGIASAAERIVAALAGARVGSVTSAKALFALTGGNKGHFEAALAQLAKEEIVVKGAGLRDPFVLQSPPTAPKSPPNHPPRARESEGITPTPASLGVWGDSDLSLHGNPDTPAGVIAPNRGGGQPSPPATSGRSPHGPNETAPAPRRPRGIPR